MWLVFLILLSLTGIFLIFPGVAPKCGPSIHRDIRRAVPATSLITGFLFPAMRFSFFAFIKKNVRSQPEEYARIRDINAGLLEVDEDEADVMDLGKNECAASTA